MHHPPLGEGKQCPERLLAAIARKARSYKRLVRVPANVRGDRGLLERLLAAIARKARSYRHTP